MLRLPLQWRHNWAPTNAYSTVYSGADQRKHQSSASQAFVQGIHRSPVNSPHKGLVTRKMFPFDDVIMTKLVAALSSCKVCALMNCLVMWCNNPLHIIFCQEFVLYSVNFLCNIRGCICSNDSFKLMCTKGYVCNSSYFHHQIGNIDLSHCCHIFSGCFWGACIIIFCQSLYIYSRKACFVSQLLCSLW